jgi:hypothetical protein
MSSVFSQALGMISQDAPTLAAYIVLLAVGFALTRYGFSSMNKPIKYNGPPVHDPYPGLAAVAGGLILLIGGSAFLVWIATWGVPPDPLFVVQPPLTN